MTDKTVQLTADEMVGPLDWTVAQFVDDGLATCRDQIAAKSGKDREGWQKDEWYWLELQKLARTPVTETDVLQFIGWLSGDIPELRHVGIPLLAESWNRFKHRQVQETER